MASPSTDRKISADDLVFALDAPHLKVRGQPGLLHVHVCVHCGHSRKREEISGREMGSGVFHCPLCETDGPLNVEIRESQSE